MAILRAAHGPPPSHLQSGQKDFSQSSQRVKKLSGHDEYYSHPSQTQPSSTQSGQKSLSLLQSSFCVKNSPHASQHNLSAHDDNDSHPSQTQPASTQSGQKSLLQSSHSVKKLSAHPSQTPSSPMPQLQLNPCPLAKHLRPNSEPQLLHSICSMLPRPMLACVQEKEKRRIVS